jgi:hypothetical protein
MATPAEMSARERLRDKLALLHEEETRLAALEDGRQRAVEQVREVAHRLHEAETALSELQADDPLRRAYAYVNQQVIDDDADTLAAAALVEKLRVEHDQASAIDETLSGEIEQAQIWLRRARNEVRIALAAIVNDSAELRHLLDSQDHHFAAIRGIKKACTVIADTLKGDVSNEFFSRWQAAVPLNPDAIGYFVDEEPAARWDAALSQILIDPDTELPR